MLSFASGQNTGIQVRSNANNLIKFGGLLHPAHYPFDAKLNAIRVGQLSPELCPDCHLVFDLPEHPHIEVNHQGQILYFPSSSALNQPINVSYQYSKTSPTPLTLQNQWKPVGQPYRHPAIVVSEADNRAYLSGMMFGGYYQQPFCLLPKSMRPNRKISLNFPGGQIDILTTGECLISNSNPIFMKSAPQSTVSLDGFSFPLDPMRRTFKNDDIDSNYLIQSGGDGSGVVALPYPLKFPNDIVIGSLSPIKESIVDSSQGALYLDLSTQIQTAGQIVRWSVDIGRLGSTSLQVYRALNVDLNSKTGQYQLINEFEYQFQKLGINHVVIPEGLDISVQAGDYIGWKYPTLGTMKYSTDKGQVKWLFGNVSRISNQVVAFLVGEPRSYCYQVEIQPHLPLPTQAPPADLIGMCAVQGQKLCAKPNNKNTQSEWQCCDQFNFEPRFDQLDVDYLGAKIWISDVETAFRKKYHQPIPYPIDFYAYGDTGKGIAVSKKANQYQLLNTESGKAPKKLNSVRCQIIAIDSPGPDRLAQFLMDIPELEINKMELWPVHTGQVSLMTFGSEIQIQNDFNQTILSTQEINYYQPLTGNQIQVMGSKALDLGIKSDPPTDSKSDVPHRWLIKTQRRQGRLDTQGDGEETYHFGRPIQNGDLIRLESVSSKRNLTSNPIWKSPSGRTLIFAGLLGKQGDSNDHWKLELLDPKAKFWTPKSKFRLIHANTNNFMFSDTTTYQPNQGSDLKYQEVYAYNYTGPGDTWKISSQIIKNQQMPDQMCVDIPVRIAKLNLQKALISQPTCDSCGPTPIDQKKQQLVDYYQRNCYQLPVSEYQKRMTRQDQEISKIETQARLEAEKAQTINLRLQQATIQQKTVENQFQSAKDEYEKQLSKCQPVRQCLSQSHTNTISAECQGVIDKITNHRGEITPAMIAEIKRLTLCSRPGASSQTVEGFADTCNDIYCSHVFNAEWYVGFYQDLVNAFGDPKTDQTQQRGRDHWQAYGRREGRQATPSFNVKEYISLYPDLQRAFGTNWEAGVQHYITYGFKEGRIGYVAKYNQWGLLSNSLQCYLDARQTQSSTPGSAQWKDLSGNQRDFQWDDGKSDVSRIADEYLPDSQPVGVLNPSQRYRPFGPWGGSIAGGLDSQTKWIWSKGNYNPLSNAPSQVAVFFQTKITNTGRVPIAAQIRILVDDMASVYQFDSNGNFKQVSPERSDLSEQTSRGTVKPSYSGWGSISTYTQILQPGTNLVTVAGYNAGGGPNPAGLAVNILDEKGQILPGGISNQQWVYSTTFPPVRPPKVIQPTIIQSQLLVPQWDNGRFKEIQPFQAIGPPSNSFGLGRGDLGATVFIVCRQKEMGINWIFHFREAIPGVYGFSSHLSWNSSVMYFHQMQGQTYLTWNNGDRWNQTCLWAFVRTTGGTLKIYCNGQLMATSPNSAGPLNLSNLPMLINETRSWNAEMSVFGVYNMEVHETHIKGIADWWVSTELKRITDRDQRMSSQLSSAIQGFPVPLGLQCYYDAGYPESYSGTGLEWRDLGPYKRNLQFQTAPIYLGNKIQIQGENKIQGVPSNTLNIDENDNYTVMWTAKTLNLSQNSVFKLTGYHNLGRGIFSHPTWLDQLLYLDQAGCCDSNTRLTASVAGYWNQTATYAVTRNAQGRHLYINGTRVATNSDRGLRLNLNRSPLLLVSTEPGYSWNCELGAFLIFNQGLTDDQIKSVGLWLSSNYAMKPVSWNQARDFCADQGQRLCGYKEYCPQGVSKDPIYPIAQANIWAPVGESPNQWVQLGKGNLNQLCLQSTDACAQKQTGLICGTDGKPIWGQQAGLPLKAVLCCNYPKTILYFDTVGQLSTDTCLFFKNQMIMKYNFRSHQSLETFDVNKIGMTGQFKDGKFDACLDYLTQNQLYIFKGSSLIKYDINKNTATLPVQINTVYPGLPLTYQTGNFDAILRLDPGQFVIFKGAIALVYNEGTQSAGQQIPLMQYWPGLRSIFAMGQFTAILRISSQEVIIFKESQYCTYNLTTQSAHNPYNIVPNWRGLRVPFVSQAEECLILQIQMKVANQNWKPGDKINLYQDLVNKNCQTISYKDYLTDLESKKAKLNRLKDQSTESQALQTQRQKQIDSAQKKATDYQKQITDYQPKIAIEKARVCPPTAKLEDCAKLQLTQPPMTACTIQTLVDLLKRQGISEIQINKIRPYLQCYATDGSDRQSNREPVSCQTIQQSQTLKPSSELLHKDLEKYALDAYTKSKLQCQNDNGSDKPGFWVQQAKLQSQKLGYQLTPQQFQLFAVNLELISNLERSKQMSTQIKDLIDKITTSPQYCQLLTNANELKVRIAFKKSALSQLKANSNPNSIPQAQIDSLQSEITLLEKKLQDTITQTQNHRNTAKIVQ